MAGFVINFMIGAVVNVLILCITLSVVARHEPHYSPRQITRVSIGISVTHVLLGMQLGLWAIPPAMVLTVWALHVFCRLRWKRAAMAGIVYFVTPVVIWFVFDRTTRAPG